MVVVAIAGMPGCGSSTTGKTLADRLGVPFFSVGSWNKNKLLEIEGRKEATETQDSIAMWRSAHGSSEDFHNRSDMMQKELAAKGNVVIDSKLSIHMLRGFTDLTVWLRADFAVRARRVAQRDAIPLAEAEQTLREKERLERENFQRIYRFDYFDQEQEADLVIDVAKKATDEIVEDILKALKAKIL